jgi:hypothetical protein
MLKAASSWLQEEIGRIGRAEQDIGRIGRAEQDIGRIGRSLIEVRSACLRLPIVLCCRTGSISPAFL